MKFLYVIVLLAALYEVEVASKRLCGPVLVEILKTVCSNGYNTMMTKKSVPLYNDLDVLNIYNDIEEEAPSYGKSSFMDDMLLNEHVNTFAKTRRRRNLLGIYDECCVKGCTITELTSYCK